MHLVYLFYFVYPDYLLNKYIENASLWFTMLWVILLNIRVQQQLIDWAFALECWDLGREPRCSVGFNGVPPPLAASVSHVLSSCVYLCFWTALRYRKSDKHVVVLLPGKPTLEMFPVGWVEECVIWQIRAHSMRSANTATNAYRHTHQRHTVR